MILCGFAFLASFAFSISFFFRDLPNRPRPEVSRTYPLNNHGCYLYLTRKEHVEQEVSEYVGGGLLIFIFVINHFLKPWEKQERVMEAWRKTLQKPWNRRWGP